MPSWKLRKSVPADRKQIEELFSEMLRSVYSTYEAEGYEDGYLDKFYGENGDWICVAEEDLQVIGYLSIELHPEDGRFVIGHIDVTAIICLPS